MGEPRFAGTAALVTGAASGIGRAVALRLAGEGADVFGVDIDGGKLEETVALLDAGSAGSIVTHVADLTDPAVCATTVSAAVAQLGHLDVLGNVAGIARAEHFTDVTVEQYRRMMAINTDAPFFLSQAAIPHLLESAAGNIVNVASNAGLMGQAYTATYCMSKGAVIQLTRSLAMEYVRTGLRVNAIAPAGVDTPLARNFSMPSDVDGSLMAPYVGFRPPGSAEDVAAMFAHLISDDCGSVHGAVVSMDSGVTAG